MVEHGSEQVVEMSTTEDSTNEEQVSCITPKQVLMSFSG